MNGKNTCDFDSLYRVASYECGTFVWFAFGKQAMENEEFEDEGLNNWMVKRKKMLKKRGCSCCFQMPIWVWMNLNEPHTAHFHFAFRSRTKYH